MLARLKDCGHLRCQTVEMKLSLKTDVQTREIFTVNCKQLCVIATSRKDCSEVTVKKAKLATTCLTPRGFPAHDSRSDLRNLEMV